ncbi:patatin-like phospholipase family protein [Brachybacterium sacelli]|uniref:NTE family protein n=1 Tax=Brachybacterium sacelli TaxID=173364 RepID=A0ABS4WVC5_9MICO|nr:patatin-like phospholipase family protein [Brachybacterium sacelli]MBP2380157.1 NTE family protein [Brachybacterium sacelli]
MADAHSPTSASDAAGTQRVDLVLEGGGVKGIALAGALEVLEERGYRVNRVAGSSAGAIAGALSTAGISGATMVKILRETDYRRFKDGPFYTRFLLGKALSILLHNGIHRGDYLTSWLQQQLTTHGRPDGTGTFSDLLYRDPEPGLEQEDDTQFRLVLTASDLSAGRLRFLPEDADDLGRSPEQLTVLEAVRASMSIPVFFRPVRWRTATGKSAWLVDGGLLSNFPVSVFDRPEGQEPRWPTFGIKLSARPETHLGVVNKISGPLSFAKAVVDTVTGFYDRMHIESSHSRARTIFIDTDAVRPAEFDLSDEDQEMLYRKGRQATEDFLDGAAGQEAWDFPQYISRYRSPHSR